MGDRFATDRRPVLLSLEALGLLGSLAYVAAADPHDGAVVMPHCPIKLMSGLDCPSCGGLRLVHDLLRGDVRGALADNLFLALVSPVLVCLLYQHARALSAGRSYEVPRSLAWGLLFGAAAWGVIRNLPGRRGAP